MAYIQDHKEVEEDGLSDDVKNVTKRVLIAEKQNAPNFIMRHFTIEEGGYSPHHAHD